MITVTQFDVGPTPAAPALPGAPPAIAAGEAAPDFGRTLTDLLTGAAPAALASGVGTERQIAAATGKAMPTAAVATVLVAAPDLDCVLLDPDLLPATGATDAEARPADQTGAAVELPEPRLDNALAWLLPPPPPPPVVPTRPALPAMPDMSGKQMPIPPEAVPPTVGTTAPVAPAAADCAMPADPADTIAPAPVSPQRTASTAPFEIASRPNAIPAAGADVGSDPAAAPPAPTPGRGPATIAATPATAPALPAVATPPVVRLASPAKTQPTPTIAAIDPSGAVSATPGDAAILATGTAAAPITVAPTPSALQPGIDLTRDPGLHRMIDHIAQLRDAAATENGARETRIRLIPDALGPVDIAVRREGESVHVHFTAIEVATRQLIAEAQSRLTDLAEARGLRIERATVDGGATGDGQTRPQAQQQAQPTPRAPARAGRDDAPESTDQRIA